MAWHIVVHPVNGNGFVLTDGERPVVFQDHGDAKAARDMLIFHSLGLANCVREGGRVIVDLASEW